MNLSNYIEKYLSNDKNQITRSDLYNALMEYNSKTGGNIYEKSNFYKKLQNNKLRADEFLFIAYYLDLDLNSLKHKISLILNDFDKRELKKLKKKESVNNISYLNELKNYIDGLGKQLPNQTMVTISKTIDMIEQVRFNKSEAVFIMFDLKNNTFTESYHEAFDSLLGEYGIVFQEFLTEKFYNQYEIISEFFNDYKRLFPEAYEQEKNVGDANYPQNDLIAINLTVNNSIFSSNESLWVSGNSLSELKELQQKNIKELGASQWYTSSETGKIRIGTDIVGRISYNGRVWDLKDNPIEDLQNHSFVKI